MLDLDTVDLGAIAAALEDHSYDGSWWIDADTGEVWYWLGESDDDADFDPDARRDARRIEPLPSHVGYGDMEDFISRVPDRRAQDLLSRAIEGRGAFRRFKDTLFEFPGIRAEWFAFRDARARRRAIEWLEDRRLVTVERARQAASAHPDPPVGGDAAGLPRAVAADLGALYGDRLVSVMVFGSRARGDATDESDLDLLVVLDEVPDAWVEHRRMEELLWRHTFESGVVITALPVGRARLESPDEPVLVRAKAEAIRT